MWYNQVKIYITLYPKYIMYYKYMWVYILIYSTIFKDICEIFFNELFYILALSSLWQLYACWLTFKY